MSRARGSSVLLKTVSSCWTTVLRSTDLLGRVGGDEFAAILENTDGTAALEIINRLDQSLNQQHQTSTGMAVWDLEEDAASLITRADSNMYTHKRTRTRSARNTA
jgi:diguanylate cyclase (GGDEF)-like protein